MNCRKCGTELSANVVIIGALELNTLICPCCSLHQERISQEMGADVWNERAAIWHRLHGG